MSKERILLLAPMGRDAILAEQALRAHGLSAVICTDIEQVCANLDDSAGAAVLTDEALFPAALTRLTAALAKQPPWSDLPVIVFGGHDRTLGGVGNVTLLDRPVRIRTLISALQAALRARRRQYQVRDLLGALEASVRDRDQFLAMLGHELRNPLAAIFTAAELIDLHAGDQMARERDVIRRQLRNMARLVDDLLDVARVTRGKIVLHPDRVDFRSMVQRAAQAFEQPARTQAVRLEVEIDGPADVRGDPVRLEQVIGNLLSNAIKYTNPGGRIRIVLRKEGSEAVLCVSDSGIGIAPEVLPRVFELFTQAPGSIDRARGGMGIGLTLVQRLVELHGGSVSAHSDGLGKGSAFTVRLPLFEAKEADATPQPAPPALPDSLRVLVVEDNPDSRELLQLALEHFGCHVDLCADGNVAVEHALIRKPDAMIVDLGLPGRDGFEVARAVRGALGRSVRLVALTGYGQSSDRERAMAAGFDAFLIKPAELEAIERALRP